MRLRAHAHRYPHLYGGQITLGIPFTTATLLDAIQTLIGTA